MRFKKIGLILVSLSSIFLMPSCNRPQAITYEQAQKWVTKNCVEGRSTPTSGYQFFDFSKTFGDNARKFVENDVKTRHGIELDENLIKKQPIEEKDLASQPHLTVQILEILSTGGDAIFNVFNDKITITRKYDISTLAGLEGIAYRTWQFNKKGCWLLDEWSFHYMKSVYFGDNAAIIGKRQLAYSYK